LLQKPIYTQPVEVGVGAKPRSRFRRQTVRTLHMYAAIAFFAGLLLLGGGLVASWPKLDLGFAAALLGTVLLAAGGVASILVSHPWTEIVARGARLRRRDRMRKLEAMKDTHWQLSDSAVRYRQFLDAQRDFIVRRSLDGRLRFANLAFFNAFDIRGEDTIGSIYRPPIVRTEPLAGSSSSSRRTLELMRTRHGKRWIAWETSDVSGETGEIETQSVGHDVTVAREIEESLKEARDRAEAASREKSRFLAAMSHEIRTPMNGILGMLSLIRDTDLDDEQQTHARIAEESARALLSLLDDILDFSKIEAGKLDLAKQDFSLRNSIAQAMQLMTPDAAAKQLAFTCTISGNVPEWVRGDEMRVRQIVLNLLSNAVKFTNAGGVAVRTELADDKAAPAGAVRIAIEVADSGIGFAPDAAGRLFDEFEQGETVASHPGGAGLGLAIAKRLAQAMSGEIVASGDPQKGAIFTAVLELQRTEASRVGASGSADERPANASRSVRRRPFSVLVAEDNQINALLACKVVERAGGTATVVEDGRSAIRAVWEVLERKRPAFDLILMDLLMPDIDGLMATKSIKALYSERKPLGPSCPPIIALTANAFPEDRERCRVAGMDDYLAKPFDARDLHDLLLRWTAQSWGEATPAA